MRILLQVEASQPAAASANAISKAEKGLFEIHGVANAAGPTTTDCSLPPRNGKTEIVHLESAVLLDQNSLRSVKVEHDENCYYLRLTLDEEGAKRFGDITARRIDKRIGIVADGKLLSAPVVKDPIFGGSIMITGNITEKEANDLAAKLNNAIRMSPSAASETQKPTPSPSPSSAPSPAAAKSQEELKNHAVAFVDLLAKGDFAKARSEFDATMTSAMSEQMLATVWEQLQTGGGKYLGHDAPRQETFGEFTLIYVPCRWERTRLDLKVVYDKAGKVSGFWVVPPGASIHGSSPAPK